MTLEEHRRRLFAYPSHLARELVQVSASELLVSLAEFASHLDFNAKEEVAFVHERMPAILSGDGDACRAWPARETAILTSMAISVKVMGSRGKRRTDPLAQRLDGLAIALACVCCVDPFNNYAGWDAGLKCVFDYDQAGLIPARVRPTILEMARAVVLVCPWWEVANALALAILLELAAHRQPEVPALVTEWHDVQADTLREWFHSKEITLMQWMREDIMEDISPAWPDSWPRLFSDARLEQQLATELTRALDLMFSLMSRWLSQPPT